MAEGRMHRVHRRQNTIIPSVPTGPGIAGSQTVNDAAGTNTASLLMDPTASGAPVGPQTTISLTPTLSSSSLATESAKTESSESDSISVGTMVGIFIGVFAGLAIIVLLAYYYFSKRHAGSPRGTGKEAERRKSGRELWVKMEEHDGDGSYEKYAIKRTTMNSIPGSDGTGTTAVGRSITVKSAKSAKTFKSLGYGTNLGLAETFKTLDLPPQLEFTDSDIGTGRAFAGNGTAAAPFVRGENPPISWDGETVGEGQSYLSLKHDPIQYATVKSPMSPQMVVSHMTPPAVETQIPQWERAEVVSPDGAEAYGGVDEPRHPYAAVARSSQETIRGSPLKPQSASQGHTQTANPFADQNPFDDPATRSQPPPATPGASDSDSFYTTKSDLTARTGAFAAATEAAVHHERMDSNERAMASLIAALNITQEEARERLSAAIAPTPRESTASGFSLALHSDESKVSLDEASFRQFPLPPTSINRNPAA